MAVLLRDHAGTPGAVSPATRRNASVRFRAFAVWIAGVFAALGGLVGCAPEGEAPLSVGAAASLREPIEEIARRFETANPGVRVQPVFGATSELAAQLRAGAPLDLLLSADEAIAQQLATEGLLAGRPPVAAQRRGG
jgi:molybdate transport system substrate-binding protein